jgi:hypothetical protein
MSEDVDRAEDDEADHQQEEILAALRQEEALATLRQRYKWKTKCWNVSDDVAAHIMSFLDASDVVSRQETENVLRKSNSTQFQT